MGAPQKTGWPPCVRCGTPDGPVPSTGRHRTPVRISGARFGLNGALCSTCYRTLMVYPDAKLVPERHVPHKKRSSQQGRTSGSPLNPVTFGNIAASQSKEQYDGCGH